MKLSANEASKRTGKSIPTITRAIKSAKISAEKSDSGGYLIDPSELFRVFPPLTRSNAETLTILDSETPSVTPRETLFLQERSAFWRLPLRMPGPSATNGEVRPND